MISKSFEEKWRLYITKMICYVIIKVFFQQDWVPTSLFPVVNQTARDPILGRTYLSPSYLAYFV